MPLVTRQMLNFITISYNYSHGLTDVIPPGVGRGIGLAFGLWAMHQTSSLLMAQFLHRSLITGHVCWLQEGSWCTALILL